MLRIKKSTVHIFIAILLGVALGLVWLLPVYSAPMNSIRRNEMEQLRAFRIIAPTFVAFAFACFFGVRRRLLGLDIAALFVFIFAPLMILVINGIDTSHFIYVDIPLLLSGICLICFSIWPRWALHGLIVGIGAAAFALIAMRVSKFGIEESTFFYRARWHLGFNHPLVTSGAILSAAIACLLLIERISWKWVRLVLFMGATLFAAKFLKHADSKNMIFFAAIILSVSIVRIVISAPIIWKMVDFSIGLLGVAGLATILRHDHSIGWSTITASSSTNARIEGFYRSVQMMTFGPQAILGHQSTVSSADTFALTDSIITSYWLHYGIFGVAAFVFLFVSMGYRIAYARPESYIDYLSVGAFWAVIAFFAIDAQGITPANLIVFLFLSLVYRIATQSHPKGAGRANSDRQFS